MFPRIVTEPGIFVIPETSSCGSYVEADKILDFEATPFQRTDGVHEFTVPHQTGKFFVCHDDQGILPLAVLILEPASTPACLEGVCDADPPQRPQDVPQDEEVVFADERLEEDVDEEDCDCDNVWDEVPTLPEPMEPEEDDLPCLATPDSSEAVTC